MSLYSQMMSMLSKMDRYLLSQVESDFDKLRKDYEQAQDSEKASIGLVINVLESQYFLSHDKKIDILDIDKYWNILKEGKVEGTELEKVEIGILSKYYRCHSELTENRDIISHSRDSAETLYKLAKNTNFSSLVEQNIVDKDSIESYEAEIWKDLVTILLVLSEGIYDISFSDSPSSIKNSEIYKDFRHMKYDELLNHLVKEHKLEEDVDIQFGLKLKKFYDNRDIFVNTCEKDFEELKEQIEKKKSSYLLLLMKAPVILIRQSEIDFISLVEWYENKIFGLITEEHSPNDKKQLENSSLMLALKVARKDEELNKIGPASIPVIKEMYEWIKKRDYQDDVKHWDMIFCIKSIASIKIQEVNQDDVYDMYIYYENILKLEDEKCKNRLKYLRTDFLCNLISCFQALMIRFNQEKFEQNVFNTLKESDPIDYLKFIGTCLIELKNHKEFENAIKLADELLIEKTSFVYSNLCLNYIRTGINSTNQIFKSKAAVMLKDRMIFLRPLVNDNKKLLVEMTAMYQFLLQKLKLEGDKQTYKENSETAIKLMTKHYPKNPDILTTYITVIDICKEELKHEEACKWAKECTQYTEKEFGANSAENFTALTSLSSSLYFIKDLDECELVTAKIVEISKTLHKDDPLSQARTISNHIEALILNNKLEEANKKVKETEELLLKIFNGKPNQEIIQFVHKFAMRLSEIKRYDMSLEKIEEAKKLQLEFQGEKSELYSQLVMLETRVKKLQEIQKEEEGKVKLGTGSKILLLSTVLGIVAFGAYYFVKNKNK